MLVTVIGTPFVFIFFIVIFGWLVNRRAEKEWLKIEQEIFHGNTEREFARLMAKLPEVTRHASTDWK